MFENLLYQHAASLLIEDIRTNSLPGSILLSGPSGSGKLTCALEIARILGCTGPQKGHWLCECPSCKKNKLLLSTSLLLAGPRDCILEIKAAQKAFLEAVGQNLKHERASRYLFIRSVRKLTLRFSQVLWEDDDKISKIASFIQVIDEDLEQIDGDKELPEFEKLQKITDDIVKQSEKLESTFMYDSLPIQQIRKASAWAHLKSPEGKKVFIIENAERMNEGARNALLKILEEPPADTVFILTTKSRGAVMPTILSRVRTYSFTHRNDQEESEVVDRVFHGSVPEGPHKIEQYLQLFLPASPDQIRQAAGDFYDCVKSGKFPVFSEISKSCASFEPRVLFRLFLDGVLDQQSDSTPDARSAEISAKNLQSIRECYNNVQIYNQNPTSALEKLWHDLYANRKQAGL